LLAEVVMTARQAEVFVRSLEPEEAQRLVKITRTTKDRVRSRRAGIVPGVVSGPERGGGGGDVRDEAAVCAGGDPPVQRVPVRGAGPKVKRGRPARLGPAVRETVCRVAKNPPQRLGRPFTTWSLSKLVEYLAEHKHIAISTESVRQILRKASSR
jgi:hypothetical protein